MILQYGLQSAAVERPIVWHGAFERVWKDRLITALTDRQHAVVEAYQPICCDEARETRQFEGIWEWAPTVTIREPRTASFPVGPGWEPWTFVTNRRLVEIRPDGNPLLYQLGLGYLPYIPCHAGCELAERDARYVRDQLRPETCEAFDELLTMPIRWDCYRGVVLVVTPIFRYVAGGPPSAERYVVETCGPRR